MSTTATISAPRKQISGRTKVIAVASGLVAAASVSLTLAAGIGGSESSSAPVGSPATASPDPATLYRHSAELPAPGGAAAGQRAAERFHHFR